MIRCPRCGLPDVTPVGTSHYICNRPSCVDENGERTQFRVIEDNEIQFPHNIIFHGRTKNQFFRTPYLKINKGGE